MIDFDFQGSCGKLVIDEDVRYMSAVHMRRLLRILIFFLALLFFLVAGVTVICYYWKIYNMPAGAF